MISWQLEILRPGERWTLNGPEYKDLVWNDSTTKPTKGQLTAVATEAEAARSKHETDRNRLREYISLSDPLFLEWQYMKETSESGADDKKAEWLAKVAEIKTRHPR